MRVYICVCVRVYKLRDEANAMPSRIITLYTGKKTSFSSSRYNMTYCLLPGISGINI